MYLLLSHPAGWGNGSLGAVPEQVAKQAQPVPFSGPPGPSAFVLHLEQNRSSLPAGARALMLALLALAFVSTLGPALRGSYVVPIAVLAGMGSLLAALEIHARLPVPFERLEIDARSARLISRRRTEWEAPSHWTNVEQVRHTATDLRIVLACRDRSVEIGRCLGVEERRQIGPLIASAFAHVKGGTR